MKLITFREGERHSYGAVVDDAVIDLGTRLGARFPSLLEALRGDAVDELRSVVSKASPDRPLADVVLLPPVPRPEKIICVGVNYANRNEEYRDGSEAQKFPSLFVRFPESFVGHRQTILRPRESEQLDYEGEIALVIGKPGRRITRDQALAHLAGLTIANEGSVRDWMRHAKFNVTQGKNFDRSGSMGPWMATADEVDFEVPMRVTTRVNGELRQDDTTANMIFPFADLIAYISTFTTLRPGDIILSGTPTGAGARFDPPIWLVPGDEIEVEVSSLGLLHNRVAEDEAS